MFDKIKKIKIFNSLRSLNDIRSLGLMVFIFIVLLVTWSGVKAVQANYGLQKDIAALEQQTNVLALQNQNQKLKNQYLNTDQFLELSARRQFGLAAPGEKVVIIPAKVAIAHTVDLPDVIPVEKEVPLVTKPVYQRNFEAWMDFILHRSNDQ